MTTAYSYIRFSSKGQAKGDSLRRQNTIAEKVAQEHSWNLSELTFKDLGVSAYTGANIKGDSGLAMFLNACEEGKIEKGSVLIVENLDRLSRDKVRNALTQFIQLIDYVKVYVHADRTLYTEEMTDFDYMRAIMEMSRANRESEHKSERVGAVWAFKRANPEQARKSKACPFWLDVSADRLKYTPNSKISLLVRIFDLRLSGMGNVTIAKTLNDEGVPSPKGKLWNPATISNTLKSRSVLGEYHPTTVKNKVSTPTGEVIQNYYPPVIPADVFNKVQVMMKQANKTAIKGSTLSHRNVLRDTGKCSCGGNLIVSKKKEHYYLQCSNARFGACESKVFRMDLFYKLLEEQLVRPVYFDKWIDASKGTQSLEEELNSIDVQIMANENTNKFLMTLDLSDTSTQEKVKTVADTLKGLKKRKQELTDQLMVGGFELGKYANAEATLSLIEASQSVVTDKTSIDARINLKRLLDTFKSFTLYADSTTCHVWMDNGDTVLGNRHFTAAKNSLHPKKPKPPFYWYEQEA